MLRFQDGVALLPESAAGKAAHDVLVLHDEDGLVPAPELQRAPLRRHGRRPATGEREVDLEGGALARLAVAPDEAVTLLHDAVHGREPQPGALSHGFGGEER